MTYKATTPPSNMQGAETLLASLHDHPCVCKCRPFELGRQPISGCIRWWLLSMRPPLPVGLQKPPWQKTLLCHFVASPRRCAVLVGGRTYCCSKLSCQHIPQGAKRSILVHATSNELRQPWRSDDNVSASNSCAHSRTHSLTYMQAPKHRSRHTSHADESHATRYKGMPLAAVSQKHSGSHAAHVCARLEPRLRRGAHLQVGACGPPEGRRHARHARRRAGTTCGWEWVGSRRWVDAMRMTPANRKRCMEKACLLLH